MSFALAMAPRSFAFSPAIVGMRYPPTVPFLAKQFSLKSSRKVSTQELLEPSCVIHNHHKNDDSYTNPPVLAAAVKVNIKIQPDKHEWKDILIQAMDINSDGKLDFQDVTTIFTLVLLSWALMVSPVAAKGGESGRSSGSSSARSSMSR